MPKGWEGGEARVPFPISYSFPASPLSTCWRRFQFCNDGRWGAGLIRSAATRWRGLFGSMAPAGTTERFIKGLLNCLTLRLWGFFFFLNNQDLAKKLRESWERPGEEGVGGGGCRFSLVPCPCATQCRLGRTELLPLLPPKISNKALLQRIRTIKSFN